MQLDINDFKFDFKFRDDEEFPASMTLMIGEFEIRGFAIRKSKYKGNKRNFAVYPPSNRGKKTWVKIFFTQNKQLWKDLENMILDQFDKEHTEIVLQAGVSDQNDTGLDQNKADNINVDDIVF